MKHLSGNRILALALGLVITACTSQSPEGADGTEGKTEAPGGKNPREAMFKKISKANKAIGDELKKDAPSADIVRSNADVITRLSAELPSWFPAGSGPESGINTEALPAIWERPDEFRRDAADFEARAKALLAVAGSGDFDRIRLAARALSGTCKTCHDQFREKK